MQLYRININLDEAVADHFGIPYRITQDVFATNRDIAANKAIKAIPKKYRSIIYIDVAIYKQSSRNFVY